MVVKIVTCKIIFISFVYKYKLMLWIYKKERDQSCESTKKKEIKVVQ